VRDVHPLQRRLAYFGANLNGVAALNSMNALLILGSREKQSKLQYWEIRFGILTSYSSEYHENCIGAAVARIPVMSNLPAKRIRPLTHHAQEKTSLL